MLVSVIHMMRTVLNTKNMFVTLSSEIDTLNDYVQIQKTVYDKKLEMKVQISPAVHMSIVPKMILQPIVENSVFHGIIRNNLNGLIEIHACKKREKDMEILHIIVTDNGHMEKEAYLALQKRLHSHAEESLSNGSHIGLSNVMLRIRQIYGKEYGLEILNADENKTSIHLWFPNQNYEPNMNLEEIHYD